MQKSLNNKENFKVNNSSNNHAANDKQNSLQSFDNQKKKRGNRQNNTGNSKVFKIVFIALMVFLIGLTALAMFYFLNYNEQGHENKTQMEETDKNVTFQDTSENEKPFNENDGIEKIETDDEVKEDGETEPEKTPEEKTENKTSGQSTTEPENKSETKQEPSPQPQPIENNGWKNAYADFLESGEYDVYNKENARFEIVYVTEDDIPELIITDGDYHISGAQLYTFENNKVVPVLTEDGRNFYGSYGSFEYEEKKGNIITYDMNQGYGYTCLENMKGAKTEKVWVLENNEGAVMDEENCEYSINGEAVTWEEYKIKEGEIGEISDRCNVVEYYNMKEITKENTDKLR